MSVQVGRNDPCWCGSGKKYKICHLLIDAMPKSISATPFWIQMRVAEGELQNEIQAFFKSQWSKDLLAEASKAFFGDELKETLAKAELNNLVGYWSMSPFSPVEDKDWTLAIVYLNAAKNRLSQLKIRILQALDERPFSFYQIREVDPGVSIRLRDLLLGDEWIVMERNGSDPGAMGRILYARVVSLDDQAIMLGCAPYPFDPLFISEIQKLRTAISPNGGVKITDLYDHDEMIRDFYLRLRELHRHPRPPKITNTDGDSMEPVTLHWDLEGKLESALDALLSLTLDTKEECLRSAKRDTAGALTWVELLWAKKGNKVNNDWDNTMLGRLVLEPGKLTAEVNSRKRAVKLRQAVEKRLGVAALFQKEVVESMDIKMKDRANEPDISDVEMKRIIEEFAKKRWAGWIDEAIPALGGLTPKQAVKSKEGRERVEALLYSYEEGSRKGAGLPVDVEELRRKLE